MKKIIKLKNGVLELTILRDGTLIFAETKRGYIADKELKIALNEAGYSYGLLENSINELERGKNGQILLATAYAQNEAAGIWSHSGEIPDKNKIIEILETEQFNFTEISFRVKKDERLQTITSTPKTMLRYPDGRKKLLKELGIESVSKLCGPNTHLGIQSKSIVSDIDGSLHISIYGIVSVYPERTYGSIGKIHKKMNESNAFIVERDVTPEAYIETPSNLEVQGFIKSSIIDVGGNIVCHYGIDNPRDLDTSSVVAGQSIFTTIINKYPVWSGSVVIATKRIENSSVRCLDTIATPLISGSEIYVGNKLYVKDIVNGSEIFLGNNFVENEELHSRKSYNVQHKKRLIDIENSIIAEQSFLESSRSKVVSQIKKLRKLSPDNFGSDMILNRFYNSISEGNKKIEKKLDDYESALQLYEKERLELSFFEQQLQNESQPEIYVLGRIEPGVVINAPNQILNVNEEYKNVSIKLDMTRGILNIQPLKKS